MFAAADKKCRRSVNYLEVQTGRQMYVACCPACGTPIHESEKTDGRCYCSLCDKSWWVNIGRGRVTVSEDDPQRSQNSIMMRGIHQSIAAIRRQAYV